MKRLSGLDAGFLYVETPTLHLHTLKVAVIEHRGLGDPGGYSFDRFREVLSSRLHLLPPFRRRLVHVPLGLDHPLWIEDRDFNIDRHLSRVVLPCPGGERELAEVVSSIAARQLDRDRPLWEITAVEGMAGGRVAFVAKLHHSLADGSAASEMAMNVLLTDPDAPAEAAPPPWNAEPVPSSRELLSGAAASLSRRTRRLPGLLASTVRGLYAVARHAQASHVEAAVPFRTPPTPFNAALTKNRIYATATLSLNEVRRLKLHFGVTVNDVFLAVATGALRRYLGGRGELPDRPLVAGVPADLGDDEEVRLTGNRLSNLFALLPVHEDHPIGRLRTIAAAMKVAKERHALLGPEMLHSWIEFNLRTLSGPFMRWWSRGKLSDRFAAPINLVVSNVPGPRVPLYVGGASLVSLHSIGPILEGIGLNITAWSYVDKLNVAMLACPEHLPDLWTLADAMSLALDELSALAPRQESSAL